MSRAPSQQCGNPTSDRPYLDPRTYSHQPGQMPMTCHRPYARHEPRHFSSQDAGNGRPAFSTGAPGPRLSAPQYPLERSADPRYTLSSNSYTNHHVSPHTLPLRTHHHSPVAADPRGYHGGHEVRASPVSSHGREYAIHRMRTFDPDTQ